MTQDVYLRKDCRMCCSAHLKKVMELTPTPPGNNFIKKLPVEEPEISFPLDLYFCNDCYHLQLGHVVSPKILYQTDYTYLTATSAYFVKHLTKYAESMVKKFSLSQGMKVADIGSNDGTCLQQFKNLGLDVIGVDPAKSIAIEATKNGIETVPDFFSYSLALDLREKHGLVDFITSHNACAHIDQLDDVFKGVSYWLNDNGIFVLEVGYFVDVYTQLYFDTIYHEHCDFHTVAPFVKIFERTGLELIAVERIEPQGGSIRVMAQKKGGLYKVESSVAEMINLEMDLKFNLAETFSDFADRINDIGNRLKAIIIGLKEKGCSIAAYGAPTKATTLLNKFDIGHEYIDFIVEDNLLKQGLFTPLSHIPIKPTDEIYNKKPDYVLILAWNFAEPIMKMHKKYLDNGGHFILPLPEPKII